MIGIWIWEDEDKRFVSYRGWRRCSNFPMAIYPMALFSGYEPRTRGNSTLASIDVNHKETAQKSEPSKVLTCSCVITM